MQLPNFTFYGERKQKRTIFISLSDLGYGFQEFISRRVRLYFTSHSICYNRSFKTLKNVTEKTNGETLLEEDYVAVAVEVSLAPSSTTYHQGAWSIRKIFKYLAIGYFKIILSCVLSRNFLHDTTDGPSLIS